MTTSTLVYRIRARQFSAMTNDELARVARGTWTKEIRDGARQELARRQRRA